MDMTEIKALLEEQGEAWETFVKKNELRLNKLEGGLNEIAIKVGRAPLHGLFGDGIGGADHRKSLGMAFRALLSGDQSKAYQHFAEAKAMSVDSDPDGGYVVHATVSDQMTKVMLETSPFIGLCREITLEHGSTFEEPIDRNEAGANWVGERQDRDDTDTPGLGLFRVECKEITAQPKITQKLIDTASIDIVEWLNGKVAEKFAHTETTAYFSGDGVLQPRGFLTHDIAATSDASRAWGTIEYVKTGANGAFASPSATVNPADVLIDLKSKLKAQYRKGAVWLMNRATAAVVQKLKDNEGRYVWVAGIVPGQPDMLLGHPVVESEEMPDVATDSLSIAFGNFKKAYTIVRRLGVRYLLDPYTAKPNVKLYTYARVGGAMNNSEAIKLLQFKA